MSDEKKNETLTDRKKEVIQSIQRAAEIYTIASVCTKMPYVFCDPETFDDEVFVFLKLEDAQTAAKALAEEKEPVSLVKVENKQLLHFFPIFTQLESTVLLWIRIPARKSAFSFRRLYIGQR